MIYGTTLFLVLQNLSSVLKVLTVNEGDQKSSSINSTRPMGFLLLLNTRNKATITTLLQFQMTLFVLYKGS